jgi:hypothetical protein
MGDNPMPCEGGFMDDHTSQEADPTAMELRALVDGLNVYAQSDLLALIGLRRHGWRRTIGTCSGVMPVRFQVCM